MGQSTSTPELEDKMEGPVDEACVKVKLCSYTQVTGDRLIFLSKRRPFVDVARASSDRSKTPRHNNCYIDSSIISRSHARFIFGDKEHPLKIVDLGSTHGTMVGREKLQTNQEKVLDQNTIVSFSTKINNETKVFLPTTFLVSFEYREPVPPPPNMPYFNRYPGIRAPSPLSDDSDIEPITAARAQLREAEEEYARITSPDVTYTGTAPRQTAVIDLTDDPMPIASHRVSAHREQTKIADHDERLPETPYEDDDEDAEYEDVEIVKETAVDPHSGRYHLQYEDSDLDVEEETTETTSNSISLPEEEEKEEDLDSLYGASEPGDAFPIFEETNSSAEVTRSMSGSVPEETNSAFEETYRSFEETSPTPANTFMPLLQQERNMSSQLEQAKVPAARDAPLQSNRESLWSSSFPPSTAFPPPQSFPSAETKSPFYYPKSPSYSSHEAYNETNTGQGLEIGQGPFQMTHGYPQYHSHAGYGSDDFHSRSVYTPEFTASTRQKHELNNVSHMEENDRSIQDIARQVEQRLAEIDKASLNCEHDQTDIDSIASAEDEVEVTYNPEAESEDELPELPAEYLRALEILGVAPWMEDFAIVGYAEQHQDMNEAKAAVRSVAHHRSSQILYEWLDRFEKSGHDKEGENDPTISHSTPRETSVAAKMSISELLSPASRMASPLCEAVDEGGKAMSQELGVVEEFQRLAYLSTLRPSRAQLRECIKVNCPPGDPDAKFQQFLVGRYGVESLRDNWGTGDLAAAARDEFNRISTPVTNLVSRSGSQSPSRKRKFEEVERDDAEESSHPAGNTFNGPAVFQDLTVASLSAACDVEAPVTPNEGSIQPSNAQIVTERGAPPAKRIRTSVEKVKDGLKTFGSHWFAGAVGAISALGVTALFAATTPISLQQDQLFSNL